MTSSARMEFADAIVNALNELFDPRKINFAVVEALLSDVPIGQLPILEAKLKNIFDHGHSQPKDFAEMLASSLAGPAVLSFHWNGYIREEAVRSLAKAMDGRELPFLLLRMNDWVPQVRQAATEGVQRRVMPHYSEHFIRCLPLIERLRSATRNDLVPLLEQIAALVATREDLLRAAMLDRKAKWRRAAFRILCSRADLRQMIDTGLANSDLVIRVEAMRLAVKSLPADEARTLLQRLFHDSASSIRAQALAELLARTPDDGGVDKRALLTRALLDPSASIREFARFHLRHSEINFAEFYRASLRVAQGPRQLAVAIGGLGATGASRDVELLLPFLHRGLSSARRAAIKALLRLGGEEVVSHIVPLLEDDAAPIAATAREALRPHAALIGRLHLVDAFLRIRAPHVRMNLVVLMAELSKWQSIIALLHVTTFNDPAVASYVESRIRSWNDTYNRSTTPPRAAELAAFKEALDLTASLLPAHLHEELQLTLSIQS